MENSNTNKSNIPSVSAAECTVCKDPNQTCPKHYGAFKFLVEEPIPSQQPIVQAPTEDIPSSQHSSNPLDVDHAFHQPVASQYETYTYPAKNAPVQHVHNTYNVTIHTLNNHGSAFFFGATTEVDDDEEEEQEEDSEESEGSSDDEKQEQEAEDEEEGGVAL